MRTENLQIRLTLLFIIVGLNAFSYNNAFRFKITGNNYTDETIIRMVNGATNNFDASYDAWKLFSPNPNVPSIYTQIVAGQELAINTLPEYTSDKSITIYTNIPASGTYTLSIEEIFALTPNYKISLTEISSNTHFRILGDTLLIFNFNVQQNTPTFTFNISTPMVVSTSDETCDNMNDGTLTVENTGNSDWSFYILNSLLDTIVQSNAVTQTFSYNNLVPDNYELHVKSKGIMEQEYFTINSGLIVTSDFNLGSDTVYLSEGAEVQLLNNSQNATGYLWDFGNGDTSIFFEPIYFYNDTGNYIVTLYTSNNNCSQQSYKNITVIDSPLVITGVNENSAKQTKILYIGNSNFKILTDGTNDIKNINVYNIEGKLLMRDSFLGNNYEFTLNDIAKGLYIVSVLSKDINYTEKISIK